MRSTQPFFSKKIQATPFPRLKLPTKIGNFEWQKSLWALQGYFVITDESSPFEWVGSVGAYPCIINIIYAIDRSGKKVAACAHLSRQQPDSVKEILKSMDAKKIMSVNLFSGCTTLSDPYTQALLKAYEETGMQKEQFSFSFGQEATQAALNVQSGEIILSPIFFPANAGAKNIWDFDDLYKSPKLLIDGRNLSDTQRIKTLIRNFSDEFEMGNRSIENLNPFGSASSFCKEIAVLDNDPASNALKSMLKY